MVTAPWMTSFLCRGSLGLTQLSPCPFPVHRTPEGAKKPRVTLVPSLQLLEKERSCRHAVSISLARALSPALLLLPSSTGIAVPLLPLLLSCPVEAVQHQEPGEAGGGTGRGENGCLSPLAVPGCRDGRAVGWWAGGPFCCGVALLSAAWFLQVDLKQGPPTVPSSSKGGLCLSPGEFGKERPLLQAAGLSSFVP